LPLEALAEWGSLTSEEDSVTQLYTLFALFCFAELKKRKVVGIFFDRDQVYLY